MGIFSKLFGRKPQITNVHMLTPPSNFTPWGGGAWESDIFRAAVDAIVRNAAKLKGVHAVNAHGLRRDGDAVLNRLLNTRWNPYMSAYDALYRLFTQLFLYNNSFAFLSRSPNGDIDGIFPLHPAGVEFMTDSRGVLFVKFLLHDGKSYTLPYADVIHLRRHFNANDLLGDNNAALSPALELAHAQNEGIIQGIKTGAHLRGILRFAQIMSPDNLKTEKEAFINDYFKMDNSGGVVATDAKMEYSPLEMKPYPVDKELVQAARQKIYSYLDVSAAIVEADYTEAQWNAFYESVIEPLAVQVSLEFTAKVFTDRERAFGNEILFESNRLQHASMATKVKAIKELMPMGLLTENEA